jgi:hypothetical protein
MIMTVVSVRSQMIVTTNVIILEVVEEVVDQALAAQLTFSTVLLGGRRVE